MSSIKVLIFYWQNKNQYFASDCISQQQPSVNSEPYHWFHLDKLLLTNSNSTTVDVLLFIWMRSSHFSTLTISTCRDFKLVLLFHHLEHFTALFIVKVHYKGNGSVANICKFTRFLPGSDGGSEGS